MKAKVQRVQLRGSHSMSKKCPLVGFELWGVYLGLCGWIQIFLRIFLDISH